MKYIGAVRRILGIKTIQEKRVEPWFKANGDATLRLNYDNLNEKSIVFDIGGYMGQWCSDIYSKYRCKIHVFEPVSEYAGQIRERFKKNDDIFVHAYGIEGENRNTVLVIDNDGSSVYKKDGKKVDIKIVKATDFIKNNNIMHIDLMKINIEGGEYGLLENLIEEGYIKNISNIQVQFHDIIPDAKIRMNAIQNELSKTHRITYQYEFVWENWELMQK